MARSKNSNEHVEIEYRLEGSDWQNLLADALLKTLQSQVNLHGVDYNKLEVSFKTLKSSGMLSIKSPGSDLHLPFSLNKKQSPKN